jgi:ADP-ribosyl-[dinitrogen reductase] hydrolase
LARGGFDISAAGTVPRAITAVLEAETWEGAVRTTICLGGDTDTLACIAGSVAEVVHGLPLDIADSARGYLTDDLRLVLERFETVVRARVRAPIGLNSS